MSLSAFNQSFPLQAVGGVITTGAIDVATVSCDVLNVNKVSSNSQTCNAQAGSFTLTEGIITPDTIGAGVSFPLVFTNSFINASSALLLTARTSTAGAFLSVSITSITNGSAVLRLSNISASNAAGCKVYFLVV